MPDFADLRAAAQQFLATELAGAFAPLRGLANHTDLIAQRRAFEGKFHQAGLAVIGWPRAYGGIDASLAQQIDFAEDYARAEGPARISHIGVELLAPTLLKYGTQAQCDRFLPPIAGAQEIWCQGYSEPNAGSDLANIQTKARRDGAQWVLSGQKIWTSMAGFADYIFVLARSDAASSRRQGLSFLLVPMAQPGITVRPIRQATGEAEFGEVFFDGATAPADHIVGQPGQGWAIAMALLGFERGISTLVQQMQFTNELNQLIAVARANGAAHDHEIRRKIARAYAGLEIMRISARRILQNPSAPAAYTYKLYWSHWHRDLGSLAIDILGEQAFTATPLPALARLHLMSRAETIYAGTSQIQRNIIAERALGLPKDQTPP